MPDANSKVTIFYESQGGSVPTGWTETFYSDDSDFANLRKKVVNTYLPKRVPLLGLGATAKYVRLSYVPGNRLTAIFGLVGKQGENLSLVDPHADAFDPTQVDLLVRMATGNGHRRSFWLAGLPDKYTDQLKQSGIEAAFINGPLFKQFAQAVRDAEFQIRYRDTVGPPPTYLASSIVTIEAAMIRNRKRGRPFYLFRGRRAY